MSWINYKDKAIVHIGPLPAAVLQGIPYMGYMIKDQYVYIVENKPELIAKLRERGCVMPHPEAEYTGKYRPMAHQLTTVEFLLTTQRGFVLNGLGTGKTPAALWAIDNLMKWGVHKKVLVVSTKTSLHATWAKQILEFTPHIPFVVLEGSRDKKKKDAERENGIFIINHDSAVMLDGIHFDLVVVDESTKVKSWKAARTQAILRLAKSSALWLMTGNVAPQAPTDAYGQIKLIRNGKYMAFGSFKDMTMKQLSQFRWIPKKDAAEIVARECKPSICFRSEDCLDLPEFTTVDISVAPEKEASDFLRDLIKDDAAMLGDDMIKPINAAALSQKVLQVCEGGIYMGTGPERTFRKVSFDSMYNAVEEIVENADTPVLILGNYVETSRAIFNKLVEDGVEARFINGDTSSNDKMTTCSDFQEGKVKVLVAITKCVAHSITLTAARFLVWLSPPMSLDDYGQARKRIYRKGQTLKCVEYRLSGHPRASYYYKRLDTGVSLSDTILELLKNNS